jgi:predicted ATPase
MTGIHVGHAYVVRGKSLDLRDSLGSPTHLVLTGPNGSGKSVILQQLGHHLLHGAAGHPLTTAMHNLQLARVRLSYLAETHAPLVEWVTKHHSTWDPRSDLFKAATEAKLLRELSMEDVDVMSRAFDILAMQRSSQQEILELSEQECVAPELNDFLKTSDLVCVVVSASDTTTMRTTDGTISLGLQSGTADHAAFLQVLVSVRAEKALAFEAARTDRHSELTNWLERVEGAFNELVGPREGRAGLRLVFDPDRLQYTFEHTVGGPLPPEALPSGLRRLVNMWAQILLAWEAARRRDGVLASPDALSGWVLIDEPETHLHAELQERVMPFLIQSFPELQFIVGTHSPVVVASMREAVVYDLREPLTRLAPGEMRAASYDELLTEHFGLAAPYALAVEAEIKELVALVSREELAPNERARALALAVRLRDAEHLVGYRAWQSLTSGRSGRAADSDD